MKFISKCLLIMMLPLSAYAEDKVLNIYAWTSEIPDSVVREFEKETGIKVNLATYGNNEIMYAKLRANKRSGYDLVMPSSYFVDRMSKQGLIEELDKSKLPNWKNIDTEFTNPSYDPGTKYSTPYLWGITGIFLNTNYFQANSVKNWTDFWEKRFFNQLMLLDDTREVFSIALLSLGYSANDKDPEHIKQAFLKLKELKKNVKVFSSETVVSIAIDEDATIGMAWNGDTYKVSLENPNVSFIYPQDGFVIWVDNFSIPKNAPHRDAAYQFLNFILRPDVAKTVALTTRFPTANAAAQKILPPEIRNNATIYPSKEIMQRGQFQTDVGDETIALLEKYWEELKMDE